MIDSSKKRVVRTSNIYQIRKEELEGGRGGSELGDHTPIRIVFGARGVWCPPNYDDGDFNAWRVELLINRDQQRPTAFSHQQGKQLHVYRNK